MVTGPTANTSFRDTICRNVTPVANPEGIGFFGGFVLDSRRCSAYYKQVHYSFNRHR